MDSYEGNYQDFTDQGSDAADKNALVRFHVRPFKDQAATLREGRPIYKDVDYIEIRHPGQKDSHCDQYRERTHGRRFGHYYRKWKASSEQPELKGTPLDVWGAVEASQIKELEYFGVKTVEQMAAMSDVECGKFMNGQTLKRKANEYIENNKGLAQVAEMKSELQKRDETIEEMREQMQAMQEQMKTLQGAKKRGRPRKEVVDE